HTCGKALGAEGALLCAPAVATDFIVNRGRPFIFSTAPSPLMAWLVRQAIEIVANEPERQARLHALVRHAAERLVPLGIPASGTQILPVIIGDNDRTMRIAGRLQDAGFDIRGIRPPTVAQGTARLRIAITLNVDEANIDDLADALAAAMAAA
ncbi:aminotransferase class I/II-fold pyridoxal phosphate-dependent enzyme, partial [Sphingopyxis sp. RIFCSPHIGHO2_12_FULL_65_19]|uniref:aminotransferase class I/II-fold pyridoxal phosphate-dependent enzyme n=1 Tax=Sphingopyxis sp. RIFCSPHIGHO2_12_FULL_65_19 TaxID=1802172 RepID=UPI0025D931F9